MPTIYEIEQPSGQVDIYFLNDSGELINESVGNIVKRNCTTDLALELFQYMGCKIINILSEGE